jgi:hypothetical protein
MNRINARSMLHGHTLSVAIESGWYLSSEEVTQTHTSSFQELVVYLLQLATTQLDLTQDYAYMCYPRATLGEAISYLAHHGKVGIHNGHIYFHQRQQSFSCSKLGNLPRLATVGEVRTLLRANYRQELT